MAETSVIREFLVALGFKTDEGALKDFDAGIKKATKSVVGLATAIETTAVVVAAGVARFASNLEALYFASVKAGASATNLRALDRAAQNFGTQAGEALESAQGLARFLREQPGGEGLLGSLGVEARDVNGELRDTTDLLLDLADQFRRMPYYLASQYAGMFGITEDTLRAMRAAGFRQEIERMRDRMRDTGFDRAAEDARRFMLQLRDLQTQLERFAVDVYNALVVRLGGDLSSLTAWLSANGPVIADRVAEILLGVIDLAERIGRAIGWLVGKFIEWDEATDGWSTRLMGLLVALKMFGGAAIISGIVKVAGAVGTLAGNLAKAARSAPGVLGLLGRLGLVGSAGGAGWLAGKGIGALLPQEWKDQIGKVVATVMAVGSSTARESLAVNDPMMYLRLKGWGPEQAAGIVANLRAESGMNPRAVGDGGKAVGVAQWHPDRQAVFRSMTGRELRDAPLYEQLEFLTYELTKGAEQKAGALLMAARSAEQAAEIVARYYERPANIEREVERRRELAVQVMQENNFHITSPDPVAAGREVDRARDRANADLVRNLQVAVQ